jgi:outer membrane scaffolding protein for murein synthesis (MipA/OmpV family)
MSARCKSAAGALAALLPALACAEIADDAMLGAGLRTRPAYDGSASRQTEAVPMLRWFGPLGFVRSTQGVLEAGLRVPLLPGLHGGAQLAYEAGRQSSESPFLQQHHVADIARGASVGVQLEADHRFGPMPVTLLVRARKSTSGLGTQADLRLSAGVLAVGHFGAGIFVQGIRADAKSAQTYYGVDGPTAFPAAGPASVLPGYTAGAGWLARSAGVMWSFELNPKWVVLGSLEARRLRGSAARSPLVERASGTYASAGVAWKL